MAVQFSNDPLGTAQRKIYEGLSTPAERAIIDKMGFTTLAQVEFFNAEQKANPELGNLFKKYSGEMANGNKFDGLLKNVGSRFIADGAKVGFDTDKAGSTTTVLDTIAKDMKATPNGAARMDAVFSNGDISKLTAAIPTYGSGQLDGILAQAGQPGPAGATPAPKAAPAAAPAAVPTGGGRGSVNPPTVAQAAAATAAASAAPASAAAAPAQSAPAAASTAPAQPAPASSGMDMSIFAKLSDEEISALVRDPATVRKLAAGIVAYSDKEHPELKNLSPNLTSAIAANGPGVTDKRGLQQRIGDNLARNPQLIRDLAKTMGEPENPNDPLKDIKKSGIRDTLKGIYEQPEKLADENFTEKLSQKFKMAEGGIGGMLKGMFGNDMGGIGGMLNGIGGFFKQIMNWFGNAFSAFSSGNFALMGNLNPGMGMWDRFSMAAQRAENTKGLENYAQVIPRSGAQGPINGDGKVVDAQGKPVMEDVKDANGKVLGQRQKMDESFDHRVEYGGHKFYMTNGLNPSPVIHKGQPTGQNHWYVVKDVDANGRPTSVQEVVLSDADSKKLMDRMQREAQAAGTTLNFNTPVTQKNEPVTQRHDQKNGQPVGAPYTPTEAADRGAFTTPVPSSQVTPQPLDQPQVGKVGDPNKLPGNDAEFAIKMGA